MINLRKPSVLALWTKTSWREKRKSTSNIKLEKMIFISVKCFLGKHYNSHPFYRPFCKNLTAIPVWVNHFFSLQLPQFNFVSIFCDHKVFTYNIENLFFSQVICGFFKNMLAIQYWFLKKISCLDFFSCTCGHAVCPREAAN